MCTMKVTHFLINVNVRNMLLPKLNKLVYCNALTVSLLAFSVGTSITWTSPVLPKLTNHTDDFFEDKITSDQASWIASWLTLGMAAGNIIFAYISTLMGRKAFILAVAPFMIISYVIMAFVNTIEYYYAARFLAGMGRIGGQVAVNMYMTEVVIKSNRGSVLGMITSIVVLGSMYSYAVGPYVSLKIFNISLFIIPCLFVILFIFVGVETPHYYMAMGEKEKAKLMLMRLRRKCENVEEEIAEIEAKALEISKLKLSEMLKQRSIRSATVIAFGLFLFQQLTGFYCMQFYNQQIFSMTGANLKPEICSIIVGAMQFLSGFISSVVMERFPRKSLLYFSACGMALSEALLGLYCYLQQNGTNMDSVNFLPILLMLLFVLTYNTGYGPLPFIIPFEVFPVSLKGFAVSVLGVVSALMNFILSKYFNDLIDVVGGIGQLFWLFAVCCVLSVPFVKFFVIETRGKSLEAIQDEIMSKRP